MRYLKQVSRTALPINKETVKEHLKILLPTEDPYVETLVKVALDYCEHETGRDFSLTTWDLVLDAFPCESVELTRSPLVSVTTVKYFDPNNVETTLASSEYRVIAPTNLPGWIEPVTQWPATYCRSDAVAVRFVSGHTTIPDVVIHAVKLLCGTWYETREDVVIGATVLKLPLGVERLLGQVSAGGYS